MLWKEEKTGYDDSDELNYDVLYFNVPFKPFLCLYCAIFFLFLFFKGLALFKQCMFYL